MTTVTYEGADCSDCVVCVWVGGWVGGCRRERERKRERDRDRLFAPVSPACIASVTSRKTTLQFNAQHYVLQIMFAIANVQVLIQAAEVSVFSREEFDRYGE